MNWLKVSDHWETLLYRARAVWPRLSYQDLVLIQGERTRLCAALQARYALNPDEADHAVTAWQERLGEHHLWD